MWPILGSHKAVGEQCHFQKGNSVVTPPETLVLVDNEADHSTVVVLLPLLAVRGTADSLHTLRVVPQSVARTHDGVDQVIPVLLGSIVALQSQPSGHVLLLGMSALHNSLPTAHFGQMHELVIPGVMVDVSVPLSTVV